MENQPEHKWSQFSSPEPAHSMAGSYSTASTGMATLADSGSYPVYGQHVALDVDNQAVDLSMNRRSPDTSGPRDVFHSIDNILSKSDHEGGRQVPVPLQESGKQIVVLGEAMDTNSSVDHPPGLLESVPGNLDPASHQSLESVSIDSPSQAFPCSVVQQGIPSTANTGHQGQPESSSAVPARESLFQIHEDAQQTADVPQEQALTIQSDASIAHRIGPDADAACSMSIENPMDVPTTLSSLDQTNSITQCGPITVGASLCSQVESTDASSMLVPITGDPREASAGSELCCDAVDTESMPVVSCVSSEIETDQPPSPSQVNMVCDMSHEPQSSENDNTGTNTMDLGEPVRHKEARDVTEKTDMSDPTREPTPDPTGTDIGHGTDDLRKQVTSLFQQHALSRSSKTFVLNAEAAVNPLKETDDLYSKKSNIPLEETNLPVKDTHLQTVDSETKDLHTETASLHTETNNSHTEETKQHLTGNKAHVETDSSAQFEVAEENTYKDMQNSSPSRECSTNQEVPGLKQIDDTNVGTDNTGNENLVKTPIMLGTQTAIETKESQDNTSYADTVPWEEMVSASCDDMAATREQAPESLQNAMQLNDSDGFTVADDDSGGLCLLIDSVQGGVTWTPSGSEDEDVSPHQRPQGGELVPLAPHAVPQSGLYHQERRRGRGRLPEVDLSTIPLLRQKSNAGTADDCYSLNSNVKGLVEWLDKNCKTCYSLTVTPFGIRVLENVADVSETLLACELCKQTYSDSKAFLKHCTLTTHANHKTYAIKRSLKLYTRQSAKKHQQSIKKKTMLSGVNVSGVGRGETRGVHAIWSGQIKRRYHKNLGFHGKQNKVAEIPQFKRGRGRPRKDSAQQVRPVSLSQGFLQNPDEIGEGKRVLRVRPIPRHEDADFQYDDLYDNCDNTNSPTAHPRLLPATPKSAIPLDPSEVSTSEQRHKVRRHSYSENTHESDASSTSTSTRSQQRWRSSTDVLIPSYIEEMPRRKRGRLPNKRHHLTRTPTSTVVDSHNSPWSAAGSSAVNDSLAQALPSGVMNMQRCASPPSSTQAILQQFYRTKDSGTITSTSPTPPSTQHKQLMDTLSDEQLWQELVKRRTVHQCTCGFSFSTPSAFYLHRSCHNTDNPNKCAFCGLDTTSWMEFHAHFFNHKSPT